MLKFLDNQASNRISQKPVIKFIPAKIYGNSYESPTEFQHKHTIFDKQSYVNPYLAFEKQRLKQIPQHLKCNVQPKWIKKNSIIQSQEINILRHQENEKSKKRYDSPIFKENSLSSQQFRLSKGEFTNFLDKNKNYKQMGPFFGVNRTKKQGQTTVCPKLSLNTSNSSKINTFWNRSSRIDDHIILPQSLQNQAITRSMFYRRQSKQSQPDQPPIEENQDKLSQNKRNSLYSISQRNSAGSLLIQKSIEKQRIKKNRESMHQKFTMDLLNRKKIRSKEFQLPKRGIYHNIEYQTPNARAGLPKKPTIRIDTKDSVDGQIETFQNSQSLKLK